LDRGPREKKNGLKQLGYSVSLFCVFLDWAEW